MVNKKVGINKVLYNYNSINLYRYSGYNSIKLYCYRIIDFYIYGVGNTRIKVIRIKVIRIKQSLSKQVKQQSDRDANIQYRLIKIVRGVWY